MNNQNLNQEIITSKETKKKKIVQNIGHSNSKLWKNIEPLRRRRRRSLKNELNYAKMRASMNLTQFKKKL